MKKLLRPLAVGAVAASLMTGVAGAQSANGCGDISNTGPGSTNKIDCSGNSDLNINCDNSVDVLYINGQVAKSGNSAVLNNTTGGYSYSGNAVNTNSTTSKLDVSCGPAQTASTTPTSPSTPGKGGAVAGASTKAASLPNTGSNPLTVTAIAAGALGILVLATRLGAKAYSYFRS